MAFLSATYLLSGLFITLASMPMIYRRVPMNAFYGIRIRQTFASKQAWFDLNEVGGMLLAMVGFPLIFSGTLGFFLPQSTLVVHSIATVVFTLVPLGFALYFLMRHAKRYEQAHQDEPS